jgi:hypothetical protein
MATTNERTELKVCASCWDARNRPVGSHTCGARVETISCHCPCREDKHTDLTSIDLAHDLGTRDLTGPFGEEE